MPSDSLRFVVFLDTAAIFALSAINLFAQCANKTPRLLLFRISVAKTIFKGNALEPSQYLKYSGHTLCNATQSLLLRQYQDVFCV